MFGKLFSKKKSGPDPCQHLSQVQFTSTDATGCEACLKIGGEWVHLRMCTVCGKVGCCDASPNRHATQHALETKHAIIQSLSPEEDHWLLYCFFDDLAWEEWPSPK